MQDAVLRELASALLDRGNAVDEKIRLGRGKPLGNELDGESRLNG